MDLAVILGASGGIGGAIAEEVAGSGKYQTVLRLSRRGDQAVDLHDELTVQAAADTAASRGDLRFLFIATGFLYNETFTPEKSIRQVSPEHMAHAFAVNAIGPALILKHFLPLVPRAGQCIIATISAKVGSIGDNELGGWASYRASKAALNQIVRTTAVELRRTRPEAVCVAIHPGTVDTPLSAPFSKSGLTVRTPEVAAREILSVLDNLGPEDSGSFRDYRGAALPW
jgi:NAD(P)-dependent dehydrogenase (short-subunit alcohol dehydrogenase family)